MEANTFFSLRLLLVLYSSVDRQLGDPLVPGKRNVGCLWAASVAGGEMLVHVDADILGGECEAEKVNVLTFLQHSVILSFLIGQFILKMANYKPSLNTEGAFSFLAYGIHMPHISYSLFFPSSMCCGVLSVFQYFPALCSIILCAPILPRSFY